MVGENSPSSSLDAYLRVTDVKMAVIHSVQAFLSCSKISIVSELRRQFFSDDIYWLILDGKNVQLDENKNCRSNRKLNTVEYSSCTGAKLLQLARLSLKLGE